MESKKWLILIGTFITLCSLVGLVVKESLAAGGNYKILAWNDLGMHCYSKDFADLAVLPPYNTLWVQVVKTGNPPQLVTSGIRVEYSYPDNTYSVGKTNFWSYDKALFGVDLPANVGLKGKGLSGTMDLSGDHFVAEGIPITEFSDSAPTVRQPYQLATVVVKDSITGAVLTSTQVVTPTSSEMRCDNCHSDTGIAKPSAPTGKVETNILQLHDENTGSALMTNRPVLCASCHASNALGAPGKPGIRNLSKSMHSQHAGVIPNTLAGCYNCHPGPQTRCLRDVMSAEEGMICSNCHGSMVNVSNNPNPWLNEPRCDTCHNSGRYNQNQALYRFSTGHGGLYCEACHDSTHAIAPSREANDAIKFNQLQGRNGPLETCSVCHTVTPSGGGTHSLMPPVISGNVGVGGVTLSYSDGTAKAVTSQDNGSYSLQVSYNWSGTITPSHACYTFAPGNLSYTNVTNNQAGQDFAAVFNPASGCVNVNVTIGSTTKGTYAVPSNPSLIRNYANIVDGPVKVVSSNGEKIFASQRAISGNSFNELMGYPANQFSTEYWFPWYDQVYMKTWILVGNPSTTDTAYVDIYIGGVKRADNTGVVKTYAILPGQKITPQFPGVVNGPVRVMSVTGDGTPRPIKVFASERSLFGSSFNEVMGYPAEQFSTDYWFPWYDNKSMSTWILVGNPSATDTAYVDIYIGGLKQGNTNTIQPNGKITPRFTGVMKGPVRVMSVTGDGTPSPIKVFASERSTYSASFNEVMGVPLEQFGTEYWFPWMDTFGSTGMKTWLLVGNPSGTQKAYVDIYIGGVKQGATRVIDPSSNITPTFNTTNGPVKVVSVSGDGTPTAIKVFTSERILYGPSFNEMMGYPADQLTNEYWFPWYDNLYMRTDIYVSKP